MREGISEEEAHQLRTRERMLLAARLSENLSELEMTEIEKVLSGHLDEILSR
ncbi:hypothetical protein ACHAL6_06350 [Proteiniclasticum sp. C24MP]|uniref:hypothetical protein n=1 Tax=Proteiniclasticum sp. C24MP TaxID=3374101 RepID=UPI003754C240